MRGVQQGTVKSTTSENFLFFFGGKFWENLKFCWNLSVLWNVLDSHEPCWTCSSFTNLSWSLFSGQPKNQICFCFFYLHAHECLKQQPKINAWKMSPNLGMFPSTELLALSSWGFLFEVPWRDIGSSAQNPIVTLSGALLSIQNHGWCKGEGPELRIDLPGLGWWFLCLGWG